MATGNYVVIEADRKAAEDSGCAVTLKSIQQSPSDHCEVQSETPKLVEEAITKRRGHIQGWSRGRPRASRFRPGHISQGSLWDNQAKESDLLEDKDSEKRLSTSSAGNEKYLPSSDLDTELPSDSSASHPPETQSQPSNGGQKSREPSRGQRLIPSRGHSRGPFAKFVTVPDASHSYDVRHVEEVNNSIVINIDRSTRLGGDSVRRGGGRSTGGGSGYSVQSNPAGELWEEGPNIRDQESGVSSYSDNAQHQKSGYQGQGRRPFRGRGDVSFRGQREGYFRGHGRGDKFRRGHGDGPRPFRGGYRVDRARGGRTANTSRRAVIVTSKSERGDSSQKVPETEEWDKMVPAAVEAGAADGHGWTNTEDSNANWDEGEDNHEPDTSEVLESGHFYKASHKEVDSYQGKEAVHQDQPKELKYCVVEQSESHSDGMGDHPKTGVASKDESVFTQAIHSPSCTKPCETFSALPASASNALPVDATKGSLGIHAADRSAEKPRETFSALPATVSNALPVDATKGSLGIHAADRSAEKPRETFSALPATVSNALPVDATKGDSGIHAVDKLTTWKPEETLSALSLDSKKGGLDVNAAEKLTEKSSLNSKTNKDSKPCELNTVCKAAEAETLLSCNNNSHVMVPEEVAEAAFGESKDVIRPYNAEATGTVDLSSSKNDSLALIPEKTVNADLKRSDPEMSSSSVSVAAAVTLTVSPVQPEAAPADVQIEESISAEPRSPACDLVEKSEVFSSEIPAPVKENA